MSGRIAINGEKLGSNDWSGSLDKNAKAEDEKSPRFVVWSSSPFKPLIGTSSMSSGKANSLSKVKYPPSSKILLGTVVTGLVLKNPLKYLQSCDTVL